MYPKLFPKITQIVSDVHFLYSLKVSSPPLFCWGKLILRFNFLAHKHFPLIEHHKFENFPQP